MPCKKAMEKLMKVLEEENDARAMCVDYGICPDCGANLNEHECGCRHPDAGRERTPFAELERLTRTGGPGTKP